MSYYICQSEIYYGELMSVSLVSDELLVTGAGAMEGLCFSKFFMADGAERYRKQSRYWADNMS